MARGLCHLDKPGALVVPGAAWAVDACRRAPARVLECFGRGQSSGVRVHCLPGPGPAVPAAQSAALSSNPFRAESWPVAGDEDRLWGPRAHSHARTGFPGPAGRARGSTTCRVGDPAVVFLPTPAGPNSSCPGWGSSLSHVQPSRDPVGRVLRPGTWPWLTSRSVTAPGASGGRNATSSRP